MTPVTRTFTAALDRLVDDEVAERVDRLGIETDALGFDRWGTSPADLKRALSIARWLYRHYFRVQAEGLDNVPVGRCLLIGNHSGQLAYDGALVAAAMILDAEPPRFVRAMIERFFATAPFASILMQRMGQQIGVPQNCRRLLEDDEIVMVFPEGHRGGGKVFRDRYELFRFGTGFLRLALTTRSPIVPFGFVGGEEMCPSLSRMEPLARMIGAPYVPLSPTLVPLPLPAKCYLTLGEPLRFEGDGHEADGVVRPMVERVEAEVRRLIDHGLEKRRGVFFG